MGANRRISVLAGIVPTVALRPTKALLRARTNGQGFAKRPGWVLCFARLSCIIVNIKNFKESSNASQSSSIIDYSCRSHRRNLFNSTGTKRYCVKVCCRCSICFLGRWPGLPNKTNVRFDVDGANSAACLTWGIPCILPSAIRLAAVVRWVAARAAASGGIMRWVIRPDRHVEDGITFDGMIADTGGMRARSCGSNWGISRSFRRLASPFGSGCSSIIWRLGSGVCPALDPQSLRVGVFGRPRPDVETTTRMQSGRAIRILGRPGSSSTTGTFMCLAFTAGRYGGVELARVPARYGPQDGCLQLLGRQRVGERYEGRRHSFRRRLASCRSRGTTFSVAGS